MKETAPRRRRGARSRGPSAARGAGLALRSGPRVSTGVMEPSAQVPALSPSDARMAHLSPPAQQHRRGAGDKSAPMTRPCAFTWRRPALQGPVRLLPSPRWPGLRTPSRVTPLVLGGLDRSQSRAFPGILVGCLGACPSVCWIRHRETGAAGSGRKATGAKHLSRHVVQGAWLVAPGVTCDHLGEAAFVRRPCQVSPPPLSTLCFLDGSHSTQPTCRRRAVSGRPLGPSSCGNHVDVSCGCFVCSAPRIHL